MIVDVDSIPVTVYPIYRRFELYTREKFKELDRTAIICEVLDECDPAEASRILRFAMSRQEAKS